MITLKPCPFCGRKVDYNYNIDLELDGVHCMACHMIIRFSRVKARPSDKYEVVMEQIAERWNRRTE